MVSITPALLSLIIAGTVVPSAGRAHGASDPLAALPAASVRQSSSVSITLGTSAYPVGKVISATVVNQLQSPIYAVDEKTDCTILTLERRAGKSWQAIRGCGLRRMPLLVEIPAGHERVFTIDPLSPSLMARTGGSKPGFGVGKYRIVLAYRFSPDLTATDPYQVHSKPFSVRSASRKRR